MNIPVNIIGLGAISAAGTNCAQGINPVLGGIDCITPLTLFDSRLKQTPLCAQVLTDLTSLMPNLADNRCEALGIIAAREAVGNLHIPKELRFGLVAATTVAGIGRSERFYELLRTDPTVISQASIELAHHEPVAFAAAVAKSVGATGIHTLSTACSSGLHAVGLAKRFVEKGIYDICLAVGADAICMLTIRGFSSLMLLDPNGCRPFDKRRAGISLGEGAGAMLLASANAIKVLGALPIASACGWGASADCHHMTAPHPQGAGARAAISAAFTEAGVLPKQIDFVATHGTATPDNDAAEISSLRSIFGDLPPFCSLKRTIGHTLAASGIIEAVYGVLSLKQKRIPDTGGFEQLDETINAAPSVNGHCTGRYFLKNSFGFGGNNAAMIFGLPSAGK